MALTPEQSRTTRPSRLDRITYKLRHPTWRGALWALPAIPLLMLVYVLVLIPLTPSIDDLRKAKTAKPAVVMSSDGMVLATFQRANREWVKLADISPNVITALIATEDRRFYDHHGIDFQRTFAAAVNSVQGRLQGGSTITQQLARNLYAEDIGRAPSLTRKVKEAITAMKIESVYSKDEILETYLNTVPFLYNAWGIEMAARTYFDKSASELNVLESATLIGMLKGTSYYNPVLNPERALQRRNTVLAQVARATSLPEKDLALLQKQPLKIDFERQVAELGPAPHFTQQLRRWLIEWADRNDYNIYADGLVVRTTIDSRLQDAANQALEKQTDQLQRMTDVQWDQRDGWAAKTGPRKDLVLGFVRDTKEYKAAVAAGQSDEEAIKALQATPNFLQNLRSDKTRLQAGFLALDPTNGQVRAWVGSRDFAQDQFDHVSQARRQPGSTFKPFVYGAAFENGSRPSDVFMDEAIEIPLGDGTFWRPTDGGGPSGEQMTLRQGLMYSKNTITAQVMQRVGPARVARLAKAMGVRQSKLDEVMSLALGTSPVTLKEMVSAYSTIANDGRYIEPMLVQQVEDRNGTVLEAFQPKVAESAMPASVAQTLLDVMRGVINQGTGAAIRSRYGLTADLAGKTGTTQDNTDGWFIMMQPQLVAGAWVGFNDNRIAMGNSWGPGARSALPIVAEFFQQAIKIKAIDPKQRFNTPDIPNVIDLNSTIDDSVPDAAARAGAEPPQEGEFAPSSPVRYITVQTPPIDGAPVVAVAPAAGGPPVPMSATSGDAQGQLLSAPVGPTPINGMTPSGIAPEAGGLR